MKQIDWIDEQEKEEAEAWSEFSRQRFPDKEKFNPWIETFTGVRFYFLNPITSEIKIEDIAHSLSLQCRFNGHCKQFYSVAEHSVICSLLVPEELQLTALLHDAAEAYISDLPKPIKNELTGYDNLEYNIERAIAQKFSLEFPFPKEIKEVDNLQLITEAKYLMHSKGEEWEQWFNIDKSRKGYVPKCLAPDVAEILFLNSYYEITGQKDKFITPEAPVELVLPKEKKIILQ